MIRSNWRTPVVVLACGGAILALSMGIRHGFGLFLQPMSLDLGWGRETFAFALALQNLLWGAAQPVTGMLADRYGSGRVLAGGAMLYVLGLALMALSQSALGLTLSAGLLIGLGLSGTTFAVVLGAVGRAYPPERRSMALGTAAAVGSFGQFAMLPIEQTFISSFGWFHALFLLAIIAALMVPLAAALAEPKKAAAASHQSVAEALREAAGHRGFILLTLGFFVCGFQVVFIAVHLPAYLIDRGLTAQTGMIALALIGLFNVIGSYVAGYWGGKVSKKYLLSGLYFLRSIVIIVFLLAPLSPASVYLFSAAIGLLWLATVPLTNGLVAQIFGVQYLAMLGGVVFFSHQIGSFLGVWLGGLLYDKTGSYDIVWAGAVVLGFMAAIANLPIDERTLARTPAPAAG
jgi:MFS family permease